MLLERAELIVESSAAGGFIAAMSDRGIALLSEVPGVRSVEFGRGVENPERFILLVEWEAIAAHEAFTTSPAFAEFRALIMPFSKSGTMEHFEMTTRRGADR